MITPEKDAESLRNAMLIKKEQVLIDIITQRTYQQRQTILPIFNKTYNKNLIVELQKYFSGKNYFDDAINLLFTNPIENDCQTLHNAIKGITRDLDAITEILTTRPSFMLKQIAQKYPELFKGKELAKEIESCTSGMIRKILLSLLDTNRSQNNAPNLQECQEKAEKLKHEGVKRWEGNNSFFIKIFTTNSPMEIAFISRLFHKMMGFTILQGINNEYSGDLKKFLTTFVFALLSPSEYFASKMNKAISGKNEKIILRILITRKEIDMEEIKQYYLQTYGKEMINDLKNLYSGDYFQLISKLVGV
jgi:hypothetical protein